MKPTLGYLKTRIRVDVSTGRVFWIDPTKHHANLSGQEAGCARRSSHGTKRYWYVKVDSLPIKRSHLVFLFDTGRWPAEQIDHINGDSLDDRRINLREATQTQNAWNHKTRTKRASTTMGVRRMASGRFQARIGFNKRQIVIGTFDTPDLAATAYQQKRKELFNDFA